MFNNLKRFLASVLLAKNNRGRMAARDIQFRPSLEALEGRRVPARVLYFRPNAEDADANQIESWSTYDGTAYTVVSGQFAVDDEYVYRLTDRTLQNAKYTSYTTITKLTIEDSYTKSITLDSELIVKSSASLAGTFTITGSASF